MFKAGARVRVVKPFSDLLKVGDIITVVNDDGKFVGFTHPIMGSVTYWASHRFELVEEKKEAPVFEVGDKVQIVAKVERGNGVDCLWVGSMDKFLNDGKEYIVKEIEQEGKQVYLDNGWRYLIECLEHVEAKKKKKKAAKRKKPRIKKIPNKSLRSELWKQAKGRDTGLCSFAMKQEDNVIVTQVGGPCHAALGYLTAQDKKVKELAYSIRFEVNRFKIDADKEKMKAYRKWVKYIINDSPFASAFLTKSLGVAFRYDLLMDVSKSRHQIAGACIALREGSEYSYRAPMFSKLLDKGFTGHTAFLISFAFQPRKEGGYSLSNLHRSHCCLNGGMGMEDLVKFFKQGYSLDKECKPFSEDHSVYQVFKYIASTNKEKDIEDWIRNNIKQEIDGDGWNAKVYYTEQSLFDLAAKLDNLIKG